MNDIARTMIASVKVGDGVRFSKTLGESDIYAFAGITGDFAPNHVNEEYMRRSPFGGRIAHGVLVLGLASTASWMFASRHQLPGASLGYDKVRFLKAVRIGDTITIDYSVVSMEPERSRIRSRIVGTNQHGEEVLAAEHIIKVIPNDNEKH
jgi:acyl dehydratase